MSEPSSVAKLTLLKGPQAGETWRTMNFTKFYVSVGNAYYKSFNEWFSCNPRTLSVIAEHQTRVGEVAAVQRDYFCCFMAVKSDDGLSYGDENASATNLRWQRTTVAVDTTAEIHCLFGFRAASGAVKLTFRLTAGDTVLGTTVVDVGLIGGSTADAKVSRKRRADTASSPPSPVAREPRASTRASRRRTFEELDSYSPPSPDVSAAPVRVTRRHSARSDTSDSTRASAASLSSPAGTPLPTSGSGTLGAPLTASASAPPAAVSPCCAAEPKAEAEPERWHFTTAPYLPPAHFAPLPHHLQRAADAAAPVAKAGSCCSARPPAPYGVEPPHPLAPPLLSPHMVLPPHLMSVPTLAYYPPTLHPGAHPMLIAQSLAPAPAPKSCCSGGCCGEGGNACACCPPPVDPDRAHLVQAPRGAGCCVVPCHRPPVMAETLGADPHLEMGLPGLMAPMGTRHLPY